MLLKRVKSWLSEDGVVVASIPNLRYWPVFKNLIFQKQFSYTDRGVLDRTHLRFFTESGVRDLFAHSGFSIVCIQGINPAVLYWKSRILFALAPGLLSDTRFQQFVVVARPTR